MSRLADEAAIALARWRDMNSEQPLPPVKVVLHNHDEYLFNGLAVAPSSSGSDVTLSSSGMPLPILVIRDLDILRIEIGVSTSSSFGFNR